MSLAVLLVATLITVPSLPNAEMRPVRQVRLAESLTLEQSTFAAFRASATEAVWAQESDEGEGDGEEGSSSSSGEVEEGEPGAPRGSERWLPSPGGGGEFPERSKVAPILVLGASIVAAIAGTVFLVKTMDAIDRTDETLGGGLNGASSPVNVTLVDPEAVKDQQKAVLTNGIATTMLMSASIAGFVTSTVLLVSD